MPESQHKVCFEQKDGVYTAVLDDGRSRWTLPHGWAPSPLAYARVVDAMLNLVEHRDADTVPVGEVFGMVTNIAADLIKKMAQLQADASRFRNQYEEASHKLLQLEEVAVEQATIAVRAALRACGAVDGVVGTHSQEEGMQRLLEATYYIEGQLAEDHRRIPPRGTVAAAFARALSVDPVKFVPREAKP